MQNKPNSPNDKTTATPYPTQIYSNIPLHPTPKKQTQTKPSPNAIRDTQHAIRKSNPNKANVKMGNINISTATLKAYANEQPTMSNKRHSKQTQSNPISPPRESALCNSLHHRNRQPAEVAKHRTTKNPGELRNKQAANSRNY
jgi:hypothetical protein